MRGGAGGRRDLVRGGAGGEISERELIASREGIPFGGTPLSSRSTAPLSAADASCGRVLSTNDAESGSGSVAGGESGICVVGGVGGESGICVAAGEKGRL